MFRSNKVFNKISQYIFLNVKSKSPLGIIYKVISISPLGIMSLKRKVGLISPFWLDIQ